MVCVDVCVCDNSTYLNMNSSTCINKYLYISGAVSVDDIHKRIDAYECKCV